MKRTNIVIGMLGALALVTAGCRDSQPTSPKYGVANETVASRAATPASSVKGAGGQLPAYYDGELFTINSVEISETAAERVGANPSHNEIFVTNDLDDEQDFTPVIDAIQGDGFNPLWEQILIVFNTGMTPHQFVSDEEVEQAAAGPQPEITLVDTHEVYRCSVVGKK